MEMDCGCSNGLSSSERAEAEVTSCKTQKAYSSSASYSFMITTSIRDFCPKNEGNIFG